MNKVRRSLFVLACLSVLVTGFIWIKTWRAPYSIDTTLSSSIIIYAKIDSMWRNGRFDNIDSYVNKLNERSNTYIPTQIAYATYSHNCEVDIHKTIDLLAKIKEFIKDKLEYVSPVFEELLESTIIQYTKTEEFYNRNKVSQQFLWSIYNPRTMKPDKRSKRWGDENLFFNAPDVLVTNNLVVPVKPLETVAPSPSLMAKTEKELKLIICGDNTPIIERKAAVRALVAQRHAAGLREVAKGLYEAELLYTYNDSADELVRAGAAAVPVILGLLNDPAQRISQKKFVIWPLVRIGNTRPEVLQTLQMLATNAAVSKDDRAYAERALRHLQQGKP